MLGIAIGESLMDVMSNHGHQSALSIAEWSRYSNTFIVTVDADDRSGITLYGSLASVALMLASLGIYGVMSFMVRQGNGGWPGRQHLQRAWSRA